MANKFKNIFLGKALDTALETTGNVLSTTDILGVGYGDAIERGLGKVVDGEDDYIKGVDEFTDVTQGLAQGVGKGALSFIPGASGIADSLTSTTNQLFGNTNQPQLYSGQEKVKDISSGIGSIAAGVGGGILTGNVAGAIGAGTQGFGKIMEGVDTTKEGFQRGGTAMNVGNIVQSAGGIASMAAGMSGSGGIGQVVQNNPMQGLQMLQSTVGNVNNIAANMQAIQNNQQQNQMQGMYATSNYGMYQPQAMQQSAVNPNVNLVQYKYGGSMYKNKYQNGGEIGNSIAYEGPSHSQGGIKVDANGNPVIQTGLPPLAEVEGGEAMSKTDNTIFSDTLKVPEGEFKGKTFAEAVKSIESKLDKVKKKTGKSGDSIDENTIRIVENEVEQKKEELKRMQEEVRIEKMKKDVEKLMEKYPELREAMSSQQAQPQQPQQQLTPEEQAMMQQQAQAAMQQQGQSKQMPAQLPMMMYGGNLDQFKYGGIYIKPENRGKFTEQAKRHGMGVQEFANYVLSHKDKFDPVTVKRANFARNAKKWKHQFGFDGGEKNYTAYTDPEDYSSYTGYTDDTDYSNYTAYIDPSLMGPPAEEQFLSDVYVPANPINSSEINIPTGNNKDIILDETRFTNPFADEINVENGTDKNIDYEKYAYLASQAAPVLYNIGRGLFDKAEGLPYRENPYKQLYERGLGEAADYAKRKREYNINPQLRELERQKEAANQEMKRVSAGLGQSAYAAMRASNLSTTQRAVNDLYDRKMNVEAQWNDPRVISQLLGNIYGVYSDIGYKDRAYRSTIDDSVLKAKGIKNTYLNKGVSDISNLGNIYMNYGNLQSVTKSADEYGEGLQMDQLMQLLNTFSSLQGTPITTSGYHAGSEVGINIGSSSGSKSSSKTGTN
jgi:hypothetical protein